jgi:hypothetical protein
MNADASTSRGRCADRSTSPRPAADDRPLRLDDPRAIQILATEHWSLLATRALSWNESFSRTSMLLATLSATVVALALAAQVAEFGPAFLAFALVALPFVELVGVATFARLGEANAEDLQSIQGMNRIRHAYVEIAPQLEPYFVAARNDDMPALFSAYRIGSGSMSSVRVGLHHAFVMTQGMVGIINAMVAGVFGFLLVMLLGAPTAEAVAAGALFLAVALALQVVVGVATYRRLRESLTIHFPSVSVDDGTPSTAETFPIARNRLPRPGPRPSDRQKSPLEFVPPVRGYHYQANNALGHGTEP